MFPHGERDAVENFGEDAGHWAEEEAKDSEQVYHGNAEQ